MRPNSFGVPSLVVVLLLAGCSGAGSDNGRGLTVAIDDDAIYIRGLVLDEEFLPIEGATVVAAGVEGFATTDASGAFILGPVEPGEYELTAERRGYATVTMTALVDEETPDVSILLPAIASDVPYRRTQQHVTFVICASRNIIGGVPCTKLVDYVAQTNFSGSEKFVFAFQVHDPGLVDVLVEMDWTPQAFGKEMLFYVQTPPNQPLTAASVKYFAMDGPRPLRGWFTAGIKNGPDTYGVFDATPEKVVYEAATVWSSDNSTIPLTSLYINHRTETWITFFHNRAGPRDFTSLPE